MLRVKGIHHISSTVGHAQRNLDFYSSLLGMRLVKQTLNYDDKNIYHLYYGNKDGSTGLVTTFPIIDSIDGMIGGGQVSRSIYAVPKGSFSFWKERFELFGIEYTTTTELGKVRLNFKDLDGLALQLVERDLLNDMSWTTKNITEKEAFIGIESAELISMKPKETLKILVDVLGYDIKAEEDNKILLQVHDGLGGSLELNKVSIPMGRMGRGTTHHIAFHVDEDEIEVYHKRLKDYGLQPTEIKNRKYFRSLYFREPGGILIELSTTGQGVLIDESIEELGTQLIIPKHFEKDKEVILDTMMPLFIRDMKIFSDYGYRDRYEYVTLQEKKKIKEDISKIIKISKKRNLTDQEINSYNTLRRKYLKVGRKK